MFCTKYQVLSYFVFSHFSGHLIHNFNITEQDWHRIKQNINSKCRTAYRRKVRGLPLTVKAFRGKAPSTYIQVSENSLGSRVHAHDLGDTSDESLQQAEDAELQIQVTRLL
jgi:hypothetical protein